MSEALEALKRVKRFALMSDDEVADLDENTIDSDIATIRAALEQPSTAEAQAGALEEMAGRLRARDMSPGVNAGLSVGARMLDKEAHRLREQK